MSASWSGCSGVIVKLLPCKACRRPPHGSIPIKSVSSDRNYAVVSLTEGADDRAILNRLGNRDRHNPTSPRFLNEVHFLPFLRVYWEFLNLDALCIVVYDFPGHAAFLLTVDASVVVVGGKV
jgi:hypothetical protein